MEEEGRERDTDGEGDGEGEKGREMVRKGEKEEGGWEEKRIRARYYDSDKQK